MVRQKRMGNPDNDLPCPQDPAVLKLMVQRGVLIYAFIISLTLMVAPARLIAVGIATFQVMGIPLCGAVGQLEVLEDPIRCGTEIAWEFYVRVAASGLGFLMAGGNLRVLVTKGQAGMKRLRKLNEKLAAAGAAPEDSQDDV